MNRIFVYGTLDPARAPQHLSDVIRRFRFISDAQLCGRLYRLGSYPGMVCDPADTSLVIGRLFEIAAADPAMLEADLSRLDAYEGFMPKQPASSLFRRVVCDVETVEGRVTCWTYLYNRAIAETLHIASGRWAPENDLR